MKKENIPIRKRKIFQLEKGKYSIEKKGIIPKRKGKIFQIEKGKYCQSEIGNWEMTEEEEEQQQQQEHENKRIRPRERALGQKKVTVEWKKFWQEIPVWHTW